MGPTYPIAIPTPIQGTETLSMWGPIVIVVKSLVRGGNNASGMCSVIVEDIKYGPLSIRWMRFTLRLYLESMLD